MHTDAEILIESVRELCLAQPEAFEKLSHGSPAFFVEKGGQFASIWNNHHNDGHLGLLLALPAGMQESLIGEDPELYYRPPYVGASGWVGIRLDRISGFDGVCDLVTLSCDYVTSKRRSRRARGCASKVGMA